MRLTGSNLHRTRYAMHMPRTTLYTTAFVSLLWVMMAVPVAAQEIIPWDQLTDVEFVQQDRQMVPSFSKEIQQLDGEKVRISGFMIPLEQTPEQRHFVLSAFPAAGCQFCIPGGPDTLVDVVCEDGIEFSYNRISVEGRFELVEDDPYGLVYRLTGAREVQ